MCFVLQQLWKQTSFLPTQYVKAKWKKNPVLLLKYSEVFGRPFILFYEILTFFLFFFCLKLINFTCQKSLMSLKKKKSQTHSKKCMPSLALNQAKVNEPSQPFLKYLGAKISHKFSHICRNILHHLVTTLTTLNSNSHRHQLWNHLPSHFETENYFIKRQFRTTYFSAKKSLILIIALLATEETFSLFNTQFK